MNRLFKLIIAFALVLSTMSVCAFAATSINVGTITESDKAVTVNFTVADIETNDDVTILVFKKDTDETEPNENNIVYINQVSATGTNIQFNLLADAAEGNYEVRMGGTGIENADAGNFTISSIIYGDVNGDGYVNSDDAVYILMNGVGLELPDDIKPNISKGDVNGDGYVNSDDAVYVLMNGVGLELPDGIRIPKN